MILFYWMVKTTIGKTSLPIPLPIPVMTRCFVPADMDDQSLYFSHILGHFNRYLYAYFDVNDKNTIYRDRNFRRLNNSDHIRLMTQNPGASIRRYLFTAHQPGPMSVLPYGQGLEISL